MPIGQPDDLLAYCHGVWQPLSTAAVPVWDVGVCHGVSVTELLRTFRHQPFRVADHLDRLAQSLSVVGITCPLSRPELANLLLEVTQRNAGWFAPDEDFGLSLFVTGGGNRTYLAGWPDLQQGAAPRVYAHPFPLPYALWAAHYTQGVALTIPARPAFPPDVLSPAVKHRSRLHWHLADIDAHAARPGSRALLCDAAGMLTETAAGNLFLLLNGRLVTPPDVSVLTGISRRVLLELASALEIPWECRPLHYSEIPRASEAIVTSTTYCLLPVSSIHHTASNGTTRFSRGPVFDALLRNWNAAVGIEIDIQALEHARPRSN